LPQLEQLYPPLLAGMVAVLAVAVAVLAVAVEVAPVKCL
jgi:hypothetical protein